MKIQTRSNTAISKKRQQQKTSQNSFASLFSGQIDASQNTHSNEKQTFQSPVEEAYPDKPLAKVLNELEDIMEHLDEGSKDHRRAQMAIHSLRDVLHELPQAFPLTPQDREEAKALLAVESKRIDELCKYSDNH